MRKLWKTKSFCMHSFVLEMSLSVWYLPMCFAINMNLCNSLLCFYLPHAQQKQSIRFLMVIKQIKKWIKVASCGLWCNIHPVLTYNGPEWSNGDTAYPEVQTNKCLSRVSRGAKVALMSTMVSVLWVTLIWTAQWDWDQSAKRVDGLDYCLITRQHTDTHTHTHSCETEL